MTTIQLQKKVLNLEREMVLLRSSLQMEPDFLVDEVNWKKIKPTAKVIRNKLYQQRYGKS